MKPRQPEPFIDVFKSLQAYSKYAHEMFVSILQIECILTERLSQEFKWGFFHATHSTRRGLVHVKTFPTIIRKNHESLCSRKTNLIASLFRALESL